MSKNKNKKKIDIKLKSLSKAGVTGSAFVYKIKVQNKATNILVDLGALQDGRYSPKQLFEMNRLDIDMSDIKHVLVSHAHLDHTMNLCQLPRLNFNGKIYCTSLTLELMEHITLDGINIHEKTAEYLNKSQKSHSQIVPYMNMRTRDEMLSRVRGYGYDEWIIINDNIRFKFIGTGHISGASSIIIEIQDGYEKETIFISGDTSCGRDIPFTKKLDLLDKKYKFTILQLESTYADNYVPQKSEDEVVDELYKIIKNTCLNKGGVALIPAFSLARSTNLFYYIRKTYEKYPDLNEIRVFGISPLMNKCHNSIGVNEEFYDDKWKDEMDLFTWSKLTMITEYSDMIRIYNSKEPCVIVASSGMSTNGMNSFLLPKIIAVKKNSVSFTGYLAEGTEGYKIVNKQQKTISSMIDGKKYTAYVKANVSNISGLSSHASGIEIIKELRNIEKKKVKHIILVHGDKDRCESFKKLLKEEYDNVQIHIPDLFDVVKLN